MQTSCFKNYEFEYIINTFAVNINTVTMSGCIVLYLSQFIIVYKLNIFDIITPKAETQFDQVISYFYYNTWKFMYLYCNKDNQHDNKCQYYN